MKIMFSITNPKHKTAWAALRTVNYTQVKSNTEPYLEQKVSGFGGCIYSMQLLEQLLLAQEFYTRAYLSAELLGQRWKTV